MKDNNKLGWISIHRQIQSHWLWEEKRTFSKAEAWIDILLTVNHTDNKTVLGNELVLVKRGERITSEIKLMNRWKWSKSKVRAFLLLLVNDGMIEKITTTKRTTLKVVNYNDYQVLQTTKKPRKNHKPTAKELPPDTNNNDNNVNNEIIKRSFAHLSITKDDFEKLCIEYEPKIVNKVLDNIENYKNNKNYVSLYLTAKNWLGKEPKKKSVELQEKQVKKTWSMANHLKSLENDTQGQ